MKHLELIIGPAGDIRGETRGFTGAACLESSRPFLDVLGKTTSDRLTSEFYSAAQALVVTERCPAR